MGGSGAVRAQHSATFVTRLLLSARRAMATSGRRMVTNSFGSSCDLLGELCPIWSALAGTVGCTPPRRPCPVQVRVALAWARTVSGVDWLGEDLLLLALDASR